MLFMPCLYMLVHTIMTSYTIVKQHSQPTQDPSLALTRQYASTAALSIDTFF